MRDLHAAVHRLEQKVATIEGTLAKAMDAIEAVGTASLEGVNFASDEAAEAAIEGELTAAAFVNAEPSGATGYTAADVRALVDAQEDEGGDSEEDGDQ